MVHSFFQLKELDWRLALHPRDTAEIIGPMTALIQQFTECCYFGRPSMPVITTTTYTKVPGRAGVHGHVFPIHVALTLSASFLGTVITVSLRLQEQTNQGPIILVHLSRQRLYYPMAQTRSQHLKPRRMYDVLMNHRSLTAWCTEHDTKGFTTQV